MLPRVILFSTGTLNPLQPKNANSYRGSKQDYSLAVIKTFLSVLINPYLVIKLDVVGREQALLAAVGTEPPILIGELEIRDRSVLGE